MYPVKLTALPGGRTAFESFVIANSRAACDLLEEEFCDKFRQTLTTKLSECPL